MVHGEIFALVKYSLHCKLLKIFDRNYDAHNKIFQPYVFFFYKINFITHSTKTVVLLGIVMYPVILTVGYLYRFLGLCKFKDLVVRKPPS